MRIKKLQEGNIIAKQDNTRVSKPIIPEIIKAKPRQDQLIDLGGEPLLIQEQLLKGIETIGIPLKELRKGLNLL